MEADYRHQAICASQSRSDSLVGRHTPKGALSGAELDVTKNPGRYIGKHRAESLIALLDVGMIGSYMYFDNGKDCAYVGCTHGWRVAGKGPRLEV